MSDQLVSSARPGVVRLRQALAPIVWPAATDAATHPAPTATTSITNPPATTRFALMTMGCGVGDADGRSTIKRPIPGSLGDVT